MKLPVPLPAGPLPPMSAVSSQGPVKPNTAGQKKAQGDYGMDLDVTFAKTPADQAEEVAWKKKVRMNEQKGVLYKRWKGEPPGYRATVFSNLSSASYQSLSAAATKKSMKDHLSVRVEPPVATIHDYEPSSKHVQRVTIRNYSSIIQRITLQPPKSKLFRLTKDTPLDNILVAPGLSVEVDVEFLAPCPPIANRATNQGNNITMGAAVTQGGWAGASDQTSTMASVVASNTNDLSLLAHSDVLGIDVRGGKPLSVLLQAFPAGPRLQFEKSVDFGVLVLGSDRKKRVVSHAVDSNESSASSLSTPAKTLGVQYITIRNVGKRAARLKLNYDPSLPIRITPESAVLGVSSSFRKDQEHGAFAATGLTAMLTRPPLISRDADLPDTCELKVEFLSTKVMGPFYEQVFIELENQVPHAANEESDQLCFSVAANVVNHKLRLRNADNTSDLDPSRLNFGVIYYSQKALLSAKLENRGPTVIKWVITHAGESSPMVPGNRQNSNLSNADSAGLNQGGNKEDAENKASMSVYPSEGILQPYQTSPIDFQFFPRIRDPSNGFKASQKDPPVHFYKVPMQLKIIKSYISHDENGQPSHSSSSAGEEPIDLIMAGKACPVEATLSHKDITFKDAIQNDDGKITDVQEQEIELKNSSKLLGIRYAFEPLANFHAIPSQGTLDASETARIKIRFKPNQLGRFSTMMECVIMSLDEVPAIEAGSADEGYQNLLVKFAGGEEEAKVKRISIGLLGVCKPQKPPVQGESQTAERLNLEEVIDISQRAVLNEVIKKPPPLWRSNIQRQSNKMEMDEWVDKTQNKHTYWNYLKTSRIERVTQQRNKRLGDDGVKIPYNRMLTDINDVNMDRENGLTPPEPLEFLEHGVQSKGGKAVQLAAAAASAEAEAMHTDNRKIKALFQQLQEFVVHKPKPKGGHGSPPGSLSTGGSPPAPTTTTLIPNIDVPLTGADLASIYTANTLIDFGEITVHSANTMPLNFLNLTPSNVPIHLTLLVDENGVPESMLDSKTDEELQETSLHILPTHMILDPMTVSGFEVTFQTHKIGHFEEKITYLVNGRYKYQIPIKGKVKPVSLDLSNTQLLMEVPTNFASGAHGETENSCGRSTAMTDAGAESPRNSSVVHDQDAPRYINSIPTACRYVTLHNRGNFSASFEWDAPSGNGSGLSPTGMPEGSFLIEPLAGNIPARGSLDVRITFVPGTKPAYEETLQVSVIDDASQSPNSRITKVLSLQCRGEISPATCSLMTNVKQGALDLGVLPILYDSSSELMVYNTLCSPKILSSNVPQQPGTPTLNKATPRGWRSIRIKNSSANACYYTARTLSDSSEVQLTPRSGSIQGNGGTVELIASVMPTRIGPVDDVVLVTIIGGNRTIKIPVKYEGRHSEVIVTRDVQMAPESIPGTIIGSWSKSDVYFYNKGSVISRIIVDLRKRPEFRLKLRERLELTSNVTPATTRPVTVSSSAKRAKSIIAAVPLPKREDRFLAIEEGDQLFGFDSDSRGYLGSKSPNPLTVVSSVKSSGTKGCLYIFDVHPGENFPAELIFKPQSAEMISLNLPVYIVGMQNLPVVPIEEYGVPSPITVSKNVINFKNKVVFRDSGILGVSHLKSVSKETVQITNNSEKNIHWSLDMETLEELDGVFRIEPAHGLLLPGASTTVTVSFQPESVGLFETQIPLHIDFMGRNAPFTLHIMGTGVEPSLAFEPSEIFLPIVPLGMESTATFSVVNYGCERTEVKHLVCDEALSRFGSLELQFPEGKLLKSDGEKLTIVVRFIGHQPEAVLTEINGEQLPAQPTTPLATATKPEDVIQQSQQIVLKIAGPLSFTTKIEISDNNRRAFYLPIHGTTDNSILTLQTHIWRTRKECKIIVPNPLSGHAFYDVKETAKRLDDTHRRLARVLPGPKPFRTPSGLPLEGDDIASTEQYLNQLGITLTRWLQDHTGISANSDSFPSQFIAGGSKVLVDLIYSISGRRIPLSVSTGLSAGDERVKIIQKQHSEVINNLVLMGALLSSVKPEYLMSLEEFHQYTQIQIDASKSTNKGASTHDEYIEYIRKVEASFHIISKEAWVTVLLQIIRVFAMQIVTPKHLKSLPGVEKCETELPWPLISKGNIYSTAENVLLKWVSYHLWKRTKSLTRLSTFTDDFRDGVPIAQLLISHIPQLESSHFSYFSLSCTTKENLESNWKLINAALADTFTCGALHVPVQQVIAGEAALEVLLLLLFLYQTLPHFIPKATIDFHGGLHVQVIKHIELSNPTNKPLTYLAKLDGSADFQLADSAPIVLPPKSTARVPLRFMSRFSQPSIARLTLYTRKMGLNNASILIFNLTGSVDPPSPIKVFKVDAQLYSSPPATVDIEITNPLPMRGRFKVNLKQSRKQASLMMASKGKGLVELLPAEDLPERESYSPQAFRCATHEIVLEANQTAFFELAFQPFDVGIHECVLHFVDEAVGEFMYQIDGRTLAPQASDFMWTCKSGTALEKPVRITPVNPLREKALYAVHQGRVPTKNSKSKHGDGHNVVDRDSFQFPKKPLTYKVYYLSPYFKGPSEVILKPSGDTNKDKKNTYAVEQNYTEIPVVFNPNLPGKYSCKIVLSCQEAADIRILSIHGVAISEGTRADLEFTIPARQAIMQEIPIVNKTDDEWTIKVGQFFNGPFSMTAKPRSTTFYQLTFKPTRPIEVQGILTLTNLQTAQKHVYNLKGVAQEPLPEEQREIKCVAREMIPQKFRVHNYTDYDSEYEVVTDINIAGGSRKFLVAANQFVDHELQIQPKKVGTSTQLIAFINKNDQSYIWYTLKMLVRPPPAEDVIKLSTVVRKAIAAELKLTNPLETPVVFIVDVEGEGLFGDRQIEVPANQSVNYILSYAPTLRNVSKGRVTFSNDTVGTFWYELHLEAVDVPPVLVKDMTAPLGKCASQSIFIENPMNIATTLDISLSNPHDFQVFYPPLPSTRMLSRKHTTNTVKHVPLPPLERIELQIVFWPSSITEASSTTLLASSSIVGNFCFQVKGQGMLPEPMYDVTVRSVLNKTVTSVISFTNPLVDPIPVTVTIEEEEDPSSPIKEFALMTHRKPKYHIGGLETLDIPFTYTPKRMMGRSASIIIEMGQLSWLYPIMGLPDAPPVHTTTTIECRARENLETDIEVNLREVYLEVEDLSSTGSLAADDWSSRLEVQLEQVGSNSSVDVNKVLSVELKDSKLTETDGLALQFAVSFKPLRPIDLQVHLLVTQTTTGGRWRFPLRLHALPPLVDDVITIEGLINKVSAVAFRLKNPSNEERKFSAFFTRDSPSELAVSPASGVMKPNTADGEGTEFVVAYRASNYGKSVVGTLIIEADDMTWSYEVRGVIPRTRPPTVEKRNSISGKLPNIIKTNTRPRNFVRENSKMTKLPTF
ncbi:Cilia- and flagella-associated protein 47 [Chytridiales sp. JEL 0842]|nr:Cilia- and flagella-associated protein 47 [Chytridiales sp. JEL 0842]